MTRRQCRWTRAAVVAVLMIAGACSRRPADATSESAAHLGSEFGGDFYGVECVADACGVCDGDGSTCAGCDGVVGSNRVVDACGVCGGNGSTCFGCDGVYGSNLRFDACGVCNGDGASCPGCDGVYGSNQVVDACGVCGGNGSTCAPCMGTRDACGVCNGDNSTCAGCDGVPGSGTVVDSCGVCGGDGSSCSGCEGEACSIGCDGVEGSSAQYDSCGVCGGDSSTCTGCDGVPGSGLVTDNCGMCGGDGSMCTGCDGIYGSGAATDACGVCGGDGSSCAGCDGYPNSGLLLDLCGVCGGDSTSCTGCDGIPWSGAEFDACGMCGGNGSTCGPPDPTDPPPCDFEIDAKSGAPDRVQYCTDTDLAFCDKVPDPVGGGACPILTPRSDAPPVLPSLLRGMMPADPIPPGGGTGKTIDIRTAEVETKKEKASLGFKITLKDAIPFLPEIGYGVTVKAYEMEATIEQGYLFTFEGPGTENEFSERTGPVAGWVLNPGTKITAKRYAKIANTRGKFGGYEVLFTVVEAGKTENQVVEVTATLSMRKKDAMQDEDKWLASELCPKDKPCKVTFQDAVTIAKAFFGREEHQKAFNERKEIVFKSGIAGMLTPGTGGGCFPMILGVDKNTKQPEIGIGCGMIQCNYAMYKNDDVLYADKVALFAPTVDNDHTYYLVRENWGNGSTAETGPRYNYKNWARFNKVADKCTEVMVKQGTYVPLSTVSIHARYNNFLYVGTQKDGDWTQYFIVQRKDEKGLAKGKWTHVGKWEQNTKRNLFLTDSRDNY